MIDLPFIAAGVIAAGILLYVVLDGFDLGVGILFPFAPDHTARSTMMNSIAPVWDGNETWLVLGGGGLMVFFPVAYAILLPAFYMPLMGLLFALIFRGVAFEFRHSATTSKYIWDRAFFGGSVVSALMQGVLLGGLIQGVTVENERFAGGLFDWLSPFSILTGIGVVCGYGLLGATWLIVKTEDKTQIWARRAAMVMGGGVIIAMGAVSILTPLMSPLIEQRWFGGAQILLFAPVPLLTAVAFVALYWAIITHRERLPFIFAILIFMLGFLGLGISLWPHIVPPSITIWDAAAPDKTIIFALIGVAITLPMILFYTWYAYSVFKGKAPAHGGYEE
ncbi:MAG: cytochrome d ubiquinol oxidase subunit II [Parvibaculum sp.]|uniref:cytochrome d ubiquinol oxidase subunit II n=1 Tax=Parvibaculum sp. TaxID=2024848 RepID=UPI003C742652